MQIGNSFNIINTTIWVHSNHARRVAASWKIFDSINDIHFSPRLATCVNRFHSYWLHAAYYHYWGTSSGSKMSHTRKGERPNPTEECANLLFWALLWNVIARPWRPLGSPNGNKTYHIHVCFYLDWSIESVVKKKTSFRQNTGAKTS